MNRKTLLSHLVAVAAAAVLVVACNSNTGPDTAADTAAINAIWTEYETSYSSGDIDAWVSLWTADGVQMPPNESPISGKDRIRDRNSAVLDKFTFDMEITNEEVGVARDFAYSRGVFSATVTPKGGGQPIAVDGKFMTILKRQPDGSWKIHRDIFNSNAAPNGS